MLRACLDFLRRLPNVVAWRSAVGGARMRNATGKERFVRFGPKGLPDIIGFVTQPCQPRVSYGRQVDTCHTCGGSGALGIFLAVETKAEGKASHTTPDQAAFLERVRAAGGIAVVATSAEDVRAALAVRNLIR